MAEHEKEEREEHERHARGGATVKDTSEPRDEMKHGGEARRPRRAKGGEVKHPVNVYNAKDSPEVKEAEDETEDFRHGGRAKKKEGGMVHGGAARERGDRAPRGRHERHARGGRTGSPLSSGARMDSPKDDKAGRGHEGVAVPSEPD